MQKRMLSPWLMPARLGLALALPSVGLIGIARPAIAIADEFAAADARVSAQSVTAARGQWQSVQADREASQQARLPAQGSPKQASTKPDQVEFTPRFSQAPVEADPIDVDEAVPSEDRPVNPVDEGGTAPDATAPLEADPVDDSDLDGTDMTDENEDVFSPLPDSEPETAPLEAIEADDPSLIDEEPSILEDIDPELIPDADSDADVPIPNERLLDELEFLEPSPNPLLIQTQPEEVDIIGTQPLTLEEALELAYRNNPDLRVSLLELEQRQASLREAQAALFPTVSLNGQLQGQNTTTSGGSELVPTPGGGFTFETNTSEELGFSYSTELGVTYNVYSSGRRAASIEAAEEQVELALLEVERRREELRLVTANEYYDLQAAIESIRISQAFLEEAERNLQDTALREEVGVGTRFDVLRAEVQVANARQDLVNAQRARQVAQRALTSRLNVPPSLTITTVPVDIAGTWPLGLEESIILAFQNRAELEQQLTQRDVNAALRRAELAALGPQVDLFANYSVSDQLNQEDGFNDNYSFGARVSWTLFEGGAAQARARQRELDIEIAERNFEEARNTIRLGVESAYFNLQANQTNIDTARLAVTQAQEALDLAILRFDAGVGTQLDILNAQSELTDAEVNLVQAIIGYNRSLAEIKRAISNIPEPYYEAIPF